MSVDTDRDQARRDTGAPEADPAERSRAGGALAAPLLDDDAGDVAPLGRRRTPQPAGETVVDTDRASSSPRRGRRRQARHSRRPRIVLGAAVVMLALLTIAAVAVRPVFVVSDPASPASERRISPPIAVDADATRADRRERAAARLRERAAVERRQAQLRQDALNRRVAARQRALKRRVAARQRRERAARRAASQRRQSAPVSRAPRRRAAQAPRARVAPPAPTRRATSPPPAPPAKPPCGDFDLC